ncbi:MAG: hypothetical protein Q9171_006462 [Xanthocarpia ochracea]
MDNSVFTSILTITAYAPIVLFTESLRVQRTMVASILTPRSIAPAITGCAKDFHRLWHLDDAQLLGNFMDDHAASVISVKHGSSFPLQNQTVLQLAVLILAILRSSTHPIIANQSEISKFCKDTAKGLSTLDIHVIANHWNEKHLNVVCGYTSHLHALTSIPLQVSRPRLLLWAGRGLAIVLLIQAASLASSIGDESNARLSLSWLALYILVLAPPWILNAYHPESGYENYTATLTKVPPIRFSCRRATLVFISRLPSSSQAYVEKWAWTNVFMPDNTRRKLWQAQVDALDLLTFEEKDSGIQGQHPSKKNDPEYLKSKALLREASAAYHHPQVLQPLLAYKRGVGLCSASA